MSSAWFPHIHNSTSSLPMSLEESTAGVPKAAKGAAEAAATVKAKERAEEKASHTKTSTRSSL